jgi:hypothetical protein
MPSLGLFKGTGVMGQSTVGMSHESSQCREPANSRNITWYLIHGEPCLKGIASFRLLISVADPTTFPHDRTFIKLEEYYFKGTVS